MNPLFTGLLDDAAVFPPGNLPLDEAVPAYLAHKQSPYADLVGAFVLAARDLGALREVTAQMPVDSLPLTLTMPLHHMYVASVEATTIPAVKLIGVEVTIPEDLPADHVPSVIQYVAFGEVSEADRVPLDPAIAALPIVGEPALARIHVEIPRDPRRDGLLDALAGSRHLAKFRTGGVRADLYPDEQELAESLFAAVAAGVPFKATAGLHHAIRNTDPLTGFEQHGFLNLLVATGLARSGADLDKVVAALAERDPDRVVSGVRDLVPDVRESFRSFGTCSVTEPVEELRALGLSR